MPIDKILIEENDRLILPAFIVTVEL